MICHEHDCAAEVAALRKRAEEAESRLGDACRLAEQQDEIARLRLANENLTELCAQHEATIAELRAEIAAALREIPIEARMAGSEMRSICDLLTCSPEGTAFLAFLDRNAEKVAQMPQWKRDAFTLARDDGASADANDPKILDGSPAPASKDANVGAPTGDAAGPVALPPHGPARWRLRSDTRHPEHAAWVASMEGR